jgi:hypothetical protein
LSAGELTRRRRCDITRALVSHIDKISIIKMERKGKAAAQRRLFGFYCSEEAGLHGRHFASTMTFW